jgi:hypothetical protein
MINTQIFEHYEPTSFFINIYNNIDTTKQIPNILSKYNFITTKNYDFIKLCILQIHSEYSLFLNCKQKDNDIYCFEVNIFNHKYLINIYKDIESKTFIVEFININMLEDIFKLMFNKIKICL